MRACTVCIILTHYCRAPYLVVLTDRGQSLRFYKTNAARLEPEMIRDFLLTERWRDSEPWSTPFAPGGSWYVYPSLAVGSTTLP